MNGVNINVFVQLYLYIFAIVAYADVLVAAEVNSFTGSYFRCFAAVSGQIPALVCVICYFADFLQLLFGCSLTLAVSKAIISSGCIAKSAYGCGSTIHNNVACCYTAACPNRAIAAADVYKSVIISGKKNIVIQCNIILHTAVFCLFRSYSNISTFGNNTMLACFGCYFLQLLFGCSFTGSCKAIISSSCIAKSAYGCSSAIHKYIACCYTACCYTASCPDSAFTAADAYNIAIISFKSNIIVQSNFIFLATVFIGGFSYSNIITIGNSTFYIFQLAYVYSVGICSACCYIDNLTVSASAAYGYCISSVSYAANAQSNTAFNRYRSTVADSNCIIRCNCILITEGNNIAYASDCVLVAHYKGIGNIVQFIVRACHEYVLATFFLITGKFVIIADNSRIGLFGNSVGTADYCYSTAFFLSQCAIVTLANIVCFPNTYIHILIGISNLVADTLNRYTIRSLDSVCRAHNIISYAGINLTVFIIYSIFRADNGCRCTLNI